MLIPSIDLMGRKIVQLVQGERKALEFDDLSVWTERFRSFPLVQVIDLDSAKENGDNGPMVQRLCRELPCQVGGGLRDAARVRQVLDWGAQKAIIGSALFSQAGINPGIARRFAEEFGREKLIFAVDARGGFVAVRGWTRNTGMSPAQAIRELEPYCSAFLYTHIDTEGLMSGFPFEVLDGLAAATRNRLIVAGGITTLDEVQALAERNIDAVIGMALYTQALAV